MKPTIVVFSSKEGLRAAQHIQTALHQEADIFLWSDSDFFMPNRSYLDSLLQKIPRFDFAVVVLTADDQTRSREETSLSPRDNLVFELGLSLGYLGISRVFIVSEKSIKIPSDLSGIKIFEYEKPSASEHLRTALAPACNLIREYLEQQANLGRLTWVPAFALAVGYFNNFILRICKPLNDFESIEIEMENQKIEITNASVQMKILLPPYYEFSSNENFKSFEKRHQFKQINLKIGDEIFRNIKTRQLTFDENEKHLEIYDVPNSLITSSHAIRFYLENQGNSTGLKHDDLLKSESESFQQTLDFKLNLNSNKWLRRFVMLETAD